MQKITKRDIQILQGISIVFILLYNMFSVNYKMLETYACSNFAFSIDVTKRIGSFCNVGIALAVFLCGFVLSSYYRPELWEEKRVGKAGIAAYAELFSAFFCVYVLTAATSFLGRNINTVYGTGIKKWVYAAADVLGLQRILGTPSLNPSWAYMGLLVVFLFAAPFFVRLCRDYGFLICPIAALLPYAFKADNLFLNYLGVLVLGIWCAESKIMERLKAYTYKGHKTVTMYAKLLGSIAWIATAELVKRNVGLDRFMQCFLVAGIVYFSYEFLSDVEAIGNVLAFLGKHSLNIWFTHEMIYRYYFADQIYSLHYTILIFAAVLLLSLLLSVLLEEIKEKSGYRDLMPGPLLCSLAVCESPESGGEMTREKETDKSGKESDNNHPGGGKTEFSGQSAVGIVGIAIVFLLSLVLFFRRGAGNAAAVEGLAVSVTDVVFLFLFLPITLCLYYGMKKEWRAYILLIASLLFYACGSPAYFWLFVMSLAANIGIGWMIARFRERRAISRGFLAAGILYNLAVLVNYKYFDFIGENVSALLKREFIPHNLTLPLGLSFFTFKAISYLVDIERQKIDAGRNPVSVALYLSFFGQIQSGPLSRYEDMQNVLEAKWKSSDFTEGIYRFIIGLNKKILLANVLANITQETFSAGSDQLSTAFAWLGAVCYSMQLFFDFSGYSDMAIGLGMMFGIGCPENFRYPYMTASVSEFWRRWHITLGAWFRDYVYIPLGGSRVKSKFRLCANLLAVWLLTGIWHGASWNFVVWGLAYFVVIAFEKLTGLPNRLKTLPAKMIYRVCALLFINFQWVIFRADGLREGIAYIKTMIMGQSNAVANARALFLLRDNLFFILAALLLCFPIAPFLRSRCEGKKAANVIFQTLAVAVNAALFLWAVSFIVAGQNNPFAYANF